MTRHAYAGNTAIAGIGATAFTKNSGKSELRLAVEACVAACDDAGIDPSEVRGLSTFTMENNTENEVMRSLGIPELTHFSRIHFGGGAPCGTVQLAAMAVNEGIADYVLCYRAFNERSGRRFGSGVQDQPAGATTEQAQYSWSSPYGLLTPASWVAMFATRMMHEFGVTSEDFGRIAVADRKHAATNPAAHFFGRPITLEEHQASPLDRRAPPPARLLPGVRRRPGPARHDPRAGPRPQAATGRDRRRGPGDGRRPADDALVLPGLPGRPAGDGDLCPPAVGELGARRRRTSRPR